MTEFLKNVNFQLEMWAFLGMPMQDKDEAERVARRFNTKKRYHAWRRYRRQYMNAFEQCPVIPLVPEPPFMAFIGFSNREHDRRIHRTDLLKTDPKAWIAWRNETARKSGK
jgi:hypothetical protein